MNIKLGEYIVSTLGNKVYDELEIDPADYNKLPASEFYDEVISSCEILRPDIIKQYKKDQLTSGNTSSETAEKKRIANHNKVLDEYIENNFYLALKITYDIFTHTGKYNLGQDYIKVKRYEEVFLNFVKGKRAKDINKYLIDNASRNLPRSNVNCKMMRNFIIYLAQKYKGQYER